MEETTGIIILAAGNSSRLGQPKQLLEYNGFTLLRNTILQAKLVPSATVVVVTGAYKQQMDAELAYTAAKVIHNPHWETGMASSIALGLNALHAIDPNIKFCAFTVCDQPFLTAKVFNDQLDAQRATGKGIVASAYSGTLGVPVLFSSHYFSVLLNLKGQEGAKKLVALYKEDVAAITFEKGSIDIDTIEDYNKLINK